MLKFERNGLVTASGFQVEYRMKGGNFTILATRYGVTFTESPLLTDQTHLQSFARVLSDAWVDHRKLKHGDKPDEVAHSEREMEPPSQDSPTPNDGSS